VKPAKKFRAPTDVERAALSELLAYLDKVPAGTDAEALQTEVYEIGKRHPFPELRAWFKALYEVLLGQDQGPRFGSFIQLYGTKETAELIRKALASPKGLAAE
jgi:lysyl-tRNA synthetase class 1